MLIGVEVVDEQQFIRIHCFNSNTDIGHRSRGNMNLSVCNMYRYELHQVRLIGIRGITTTEGGWDTSLIC